MLQISNKTEHNWFYIYVHISAHTNGSKSHSLVRKIKSKSPGNNMTHFRSNLDDAGSSGTLTGVKWDNIKNTQFCHLTISDCKLFGSQELKL